MLTGGRARPVARRYAPFALAIAAAGCMAGGAALTATSSPSPSTATTSAVGATGEPGARPGSSNGGRPIVVATTTKGTR